MGPRGGMWCRLGVREREGRGVGIGWTYMVMKMQRRHGRIASSTLRFSHALSTLPPPARGLFVWALGGVGSGLLLLRRRRFRPLSTPGLHSAPAPITHSSATQNPISPSLSTRMPDQHAASSFPTHLRPRPDEQPHARGPASAEACPPPPRPPARPRCRGCVPGRPPRGSAVSPRRGP